MPYTTNVAGTVITAAWANANVRDQGIVPFATTTAMTSAITSPVVGMLEYISANDATEGLISRNSANQWRKPWNIPWGIISIAVDHRHTDRHSVAADLTSFTSTWTNIANRYIRITAAVRVTQNTSAGAAELYITDTVPTTVNRASLTLASTNTGYLFLQHTFTPAAGSVTYKARLQHFRRHSGHDRVRDSARSLHRGRPRPVRCARMTQVIDYSFSRPAPSDIAGAGYVGVIRYLSGGGNRKDITRDELDALHGAGLAVGLVWETTASRAGEAQYAGRLDAENATHRPIRSAGRRTGPSTSLLTSKPYGARSPRTSPPPGCARRARSASTAATT